MVDEFQAAPVAAQRRFSGARAGQRGEFQDDGQVVGEFAAVGAPPGGPVSLGEGEQRHAPAAGVAVQVVGEVEAALAAQVEDFYVVAFQCVGGLGREPGGEGGQLVGCGRGWQGVHGRGQRGPLGGQFGVRVLQQERQQPQHERALSGLFAAGAGCAPGCRADACAQGAHAVSPARLSVVVRRRRAGMPSMTLRSVPDGASALSTGQRSSIALSAAASSR